jgi:hypothetical protein
MRDGALFDRLRMRNRIDHHEVSTAIIRGAQQEVDGRKRQISQGGGLLQKRRVSSSRGGGRVSSSSRLTSTETSS